MRIALTGSHRTGKSTLADALAKATPGMTATLEPYYHLERQGYRFSQPLSLDDFVRQLEYSLALLKTPAGSIVFDRCPLDFLGYIVCHREARSFDFEDWVPRIQESLRTLDLLVCVPIEEPDRVDSPLSTEERASRTAVDQAIRGLLASKIFQEPGVDLLTVSGAVPDRVQQILSLLWGRTPFDGDFPR